MVYRFLISCLIFFIIASCVNHDINKKFDCNKSDLTLGLDSIISTSGCGIADGAIYVTASGGNEPYTYLINDGSAQSLNSFTGLSSGVYTVAVKDNNGCKVSIDNIVILANGFKFSAVVAEDNQCFTNNGSITIQVLEGNGPFMYKLNLSDFSDNNIFNNLSSGKYNVVIRDATACTIQLNITVPRGNTGVRWATDILPIMKTSCAINGCHDGKSRDDYRLYVNVKKDLQSVKTMTKNRTMPFDGTPLPQSQIDQIGCWVDDGGLEN